MTWIHVALDAGSIVARTQDMTDVRDVQIKMDRRAIKHEEIENEALDAWSEGGSKGMNSARMPREQNEAFRYICLQ